MSIKLQLDNHFDIIYTSNNPELDTKNQNHFYLLKLMTTMPII